MSPSTRRPRKARHGTGRAAEKWFAMQKVMTGFLVFAVGPAAAKLVLPGMRWLVAAVPSLDRLEIRP